jgi:hypothetical protein
MPQAPPSTLARGNAPQPGPDPYLTNVAITGGIALEMVERTNQMLLDRAKGRDVVVDEAEVIERGWAGVSRGRRELLESLHEGMRSYEALRDTLVQLEAR